MLSVVGAFAEPSTHSVDKMSPAWVKMLNSSSEQGVNRLYFDQGHVVHLLLTAAVLSLAEH